MDLHQLIDGAIRNYASDIHLMEGRVPYLRVFDDLLPVKMAPVSRQEQVDLLEEIMPKDLKRRLVKNRGVDFVFQHGDIVRCRVNAFYERGHLEVVIRLVPFKVKSIEELEMPELLKDFARVRRGLILVTGAAGSGKSTTLAAIINEINQTQKDSIITIEDPIEYIHQDKRSVISQREVGEDVPTFAVGLVQSLRQDPDVILVGEMRNLDTTRTAIQAAETGHLVFSTLHTSSAIQTVERILGIFPEAERDLVRDLLGNNLKAAISQELLTRADRKGRVAALEIMVVNSTVSKKILEDEMAEIYEVMKGREDGMQTLDYALAQLVRQKKVEQEEADRLARDRATFLRYIKGIQATGDRGVIG